MSVTPRLQVPLQKYNAWWIGGAAEFFFQPTNRAALQAYIQSRPADERIMVLGLGSNVLIPDEGLKGSVIVLQGGLRECEFVQAGQVRFEAGVTCAKAARFSLKHDLPQAAFWAGIPGTIGGALAMNAGCFGHETWQYVQSVEVLDRQGQYHVRYPDAYQIGYRSVSPLNDEIFVAATFEFPTDLAGNAAQSIKELLRKRAATQPIGLRSCGSVYTNPPGDYAARLIEAAGLKGKQCGGAVISDKHANFIINQDGATARDVLSLMHDVESKVLEHFDIRLKPEVKLLTTEASTRG